MTKREMYVAIVNGMVDAEVVAMAQAELEKLDLANAKKSSKSASAKAKEYQPLIAEAYQFLAGNGGALTSEVAEHIGVSTQKAQAVLRKMYDQGIVDVIDKKVEKVGTRKFYMVATVE